jgi:hypothetical protein
MMRWAWLLSLVPFWALAPESVAASTAADEAQIVSEQVALDTAEAPDAVRADAIAKQFNVTPEQVAEMRARKQGWGTITIELSMAEQLMKRDPQTYPTMNDALTKIDALRAEDHGWGAIAKELGFKLGPVVSAARHARNELRRQERIEASPEGRERPAKARGTKVEGRAKAHRSERPPKGR